MNKNNELKAVGYVRVSTKDQAENGISPENQEAKIRAYADLHDLTLIDMLFDKVSGGTLNREGVQRVLDMAQKGQIHAVIIYKLDRMFRNTSDALNKATMLNDCDVALHSVTEHIDTKSAMGKFFFTIMAAVATMEKDIIGERTADALRFMAFKGEVSNHPRYGWTIINKTKKHKGDLVENEKEQAVISEIKLQHEEGRSLQYIANNLNAIGTPAKKGGEWSAQTISKVLKDNETL